MRRQEYFRTIPQPVKRGEQVDGDAEVVRQHVEAAHGYKGCLTATEEPGRLVISAQVKRHHSEAVQVVERARKCEEDIDAERQP